MTMYARLHYNGSVLESDNAFTFNAGTNQITTTVADQVFTIKQDSTGNQQFAKSFTFKAKSGVINFDLNNSSDHRLKVEIDEIRGIENNMYLASFTVSVALGAIFEFDCLI